MLFIHLRERKKKPHLYERETDGLPSTHTHETHNLSMCPDGESNPHPFGVQDDTPTN